MNDFLDFISQVINGADCEMKYGSEWKDTYLYGIHSPLTIQTWYNEGSVRLKNKGKCSDEFLLFLAACLSGKQSQRKIESAWEDFNVTDVFHLKGMVEHFNKGLLRLKPKTHMVEKGRIMYKNNILKEFNFTFYPMTIKMFKQEFKTCEFVSFLHPVEMIEEEIDE